MNYLLESTVCITIFYGLYYLIFKRLTFIRLNRIYLLSSLVIGLSLPLISYQIKEVVKIPATVEYEETNLVPLVMNSSTPLISNTPIEETFDWKVILQGIYVLGILFMLIKFSIIIYKLLKIKSIASANDFIPTKSKYANSSFFNLIFIDDANLSEHEINQILEHEKWHIRLFHSYDLMFVEILKIVFWFNPILWLYQRSLSEVHEYEVDIRMIQTYNPQMYAHLLLKLANPTTQSATHQFSRKPLTDRIHFLFTKQKSVPMKRLAYLSVLPILGAFFMAFSVEKVVDYQEVEESSKYFKIMRGDGSKMEVNNDMTKVAYLRLSKDEISLAISYDKITVEAINDASKYFKNYGFTLAVPMSVSKSKGDVGEARFRVKRLSSIEISLTEDNKEVKIKERNKGIYEMYNDGFLFDLDYWRKENKSKRDFISIIANKKTGQHSVSLAQLSSSPPPPVPPKPPLAPKAPPKPPVPPKLGFNILKSKTLGWDKNKIENFAKSIKIILGKHNEIAVEAQQLKEGIYVSKPITQNEWKTFLDYINKNPYYLSEYKKKMIPDNWKKIRIKSDKLPVTFVSFEQANAYCNWKSKLLNDKAKKKNYHIDYITIRATAPNDEYSAK